MKSLMSYLFAGLVSLFGLVGVASAAGSVYDTLVAGVDVTAVETAIVALAAILIGPQVVLWCVNKLRGMLGHR